MTFEIRKIGIIGAGQMGTGITQVSALAGFDVVLNDLSEEQIVAAIARIDTNLGRLVEREALTADEKRRLWRASGPPPNFRPSRTPIW